MNARNIMVYIWKGKKGSFMEVEEKRKRPHIPEKTKLQLYIKAGGRCEFRGCNKYLFEDEVTRQPRKMVNIAHIVSWTPSGPRGNEDSEKLATDISNLMLTCVEHNNLIDSSEYVEEYPAELLRQFKREHEERIYRVTGMGQDYGIRIIKMYSKIQDQTPHIGDRSVSEAIMPYYPLDTGINIDLTQVENIEEAQKQISRIVELHISSDEKEEGYGVFIMAKIPYSCYLGYILGNKVKSEVFQFFRDSEDWKWRSGEFGHFSIVKPRERLDEQQVVLLVEVSGNIDYALIPNYPVYSVKADSPGVLFLQSKEQLIEFRIKFREILSIIREIHSEACTVHLILAAPNPITFEIGKSIMKNIDPTILLYDKVQDDIKYKEIMCLHKRISRAENASSIE